MIAGTLPHPSRIGWHSHAPDRSQCSKRVSTAFRLYGRNGAAFIGLRVYICIFISIQFNTHTYIYISHIYIYICTYITTFTLASEVGEAAESSTYEILHGLEGGDRLHSKMTDMI